MSFYYYFPYATTILTCELGYLCASMEESVQLFSKQIDILIVLENWSIEYPTRADNIFFSIKKFFTFAGSERLQSHYLQAQKNSMWVVESLLFTKYMQCSAFAHGRGGKSVEHQLVTPKPNYATDKPRKRLRRC